MRFRFIATAVVAVAAVLVLASCSDQTGVQDSCPYATPALPPPENADIPDTVAVCGNRLALECHLWRDFMPVAPPEGQPLRAVVQLIELDSQALPDTLALEHLWVIEATAFWSTDFEPGEIPGLPPHESGRLATCGPKWDPGILVDVVVRLRCGGERHFLRARNVRIEATS